MLAAHLVGTRGAVRRMTARTTARVMHSFGPRSERENPYLWLLEDALAARGVVSARFAWSAALRTRYDVLHVHWPEYLVRGPSRLDRARRAALLALLVARLRLVGRPIVRTVHNAEPHEAGGPIERFAVRLLERSTTAWIHFAAPDGVDGPPHFVAPNGDYADWAGEHPHARAQPGRLVLFGQVRRYKNVPTLIRCFRELDDPALALEILGAPSHADLEQEVRVAAEGDPRIALALHHVPDDELVRAVTRAQLVVLPYSQLLNSAAVVAALTLARPVLVPETPGTTLIGDEVGPGWVLTYRGELTAEVLRGALAQVAAGPPATAPDLSARSWPSVAARHVEAYGWAALAARRRPGAVRRGAAGPGPRPGA